MFRFRPASLACAVFACAVIACAVIAFAGWAAPASAANLDAEAADALVRAQWFEGIPEERIEPLDVGAVAHLERMLGDAAEVEHHAACVELLGRAGGPDAFRVLAAFADREPTGEVAGPVYRARLALPLAWGALARRDDRALGRAVALARRGAALARWSHGSLDPSEVRALERDLALGALERSGRRGPEVDALLRGRRGGAR